MDESSSAISTMCCCFGFSLSSTACALVVIRLSPTVDTKVNLDREKDRRKRSKEKKTRTDALTLFHALDGDPRIADNPLGVRGEQTVQRGRGRLSTSSPTMSLGDLLVLAVIDTVEAWSSSSVPLLGVPGEDGGKPFLHGFPWSAKIIAEVYSGIDLLSGVLYIAVGLAL
ncbi:hypothetical protein CORC01_14394 [Colletotrichum orchidophilum]|uniref:Uncharacterized protein n=1 Tax=Colletotrichum orchidophilum TaxID=1209926 RepID=A0A1G4AMC2_9PEZI|nr:uncharacterized protein CORC01_14394 [Colletotrichum orchidophilum]OHE90307.1 hypothetical protein CORC01_14394 [Colletotrichum orchidophilum]